MKGKRTNAKETQTRRRFFKTTGVSAAASLAAAYAPLGPGRPAVGAVQSGGESRGALPFRLGLASYTLRKFGLEETLAMTKRVGLQYICFKSFHLPLDSSREQIAQTVAKVKDAGLTLYGGGVITMNNEEQVNQAFEYAKAAGMTTIVGVPVQNVLPLVDRKVKQYNIKVAIHNHGPGDKNYPTPQSAYEKVKNLDKRIGLCIDIGHTVRIGADPVRAAELYADRLHDVHIKDESEASPKGKAIEIGRGVIDIPRFLRTLIRTKYAGIVAFEYEKDPDDPLAGLAESVGYVRGVLAAL